MSGETGFEDWVSWLVDTRLCHSLTVAAAADTQTRYDTHTTHTQAARIDKREMVGWYSLEGWENVSR